MIEQLNSTHLRQAWPQFSLTAHKLFRILYLTQDFVPSSQIETELNVSQDFTGVRAGISRILDDIDDYSRSHDCFYQDDSDGYRLADHLRPVVGELLGYHDEEKTSLLDAIWAIKGMLYSLTMRLDDIPGDESGIVTHEFRQRNRELEEHMQSLLKPPPQ